METKKQYCSTCRVKKFWCDKCRLKNKPVDSLMTEQDYNGTNTYYDDASGAST